MQRFPLLQRMSLVLAPLFFLWPQQPTVASDTPDSDTARASSTTQNKTFGPIDPFLFRRAVTSGLLTAREAKTAFEFAQLLEDKANGTLSEEEVDDQLKELGVSRAEGEALLKKLSSAANLIENGDFETGNNDSADNWKTSSVHPLMRSEEEAKTGNHSIHSLLINDGATPCEGLLRSVIPVEGDQTYRLNFWIKPISIGPSFVSQYHLEWFDADGRPTGRTDFTAFSGPINEWTKIEIPKLVAPQRSKSLLLTFRFVTGAIDGGHGEIYLDDVGLFPTTENGDE